MHENHLTVDPTPATEALQPFTQAGGDKVLIRCPPGGFKGRIDDKPQNIGGSRFLQKILDFLRDGAD